MACGALSGVFSVPMSHKKDARFTWVIVHAIAILYVSGISQQDSRAAVKNEKDLKFVCSIFYFTSLYVVLYMYLNLNLYVAGPFSVDAMGRELGE